jgi:hypothetical protein
VPNSFAGHSMDGEKKHKLNNLGFAIKCPESALKRKRALSDGAESKPIKDSDTDEEVHEILVELSRKIQRTARNIGLQSQNFRIVSRYSM